MIFLLRHGEIATRPGRTFVGQSDLPLGEEGRRQALLWRRAFAGRPFERAFTSDLARCRETAGLVLGPKPPNPSDGPAGPRPEVLPDLREISLGAWEGLTAEEVRRRFPGQWEARGRDILGARPEGGESFADLRERVVPAFEAIAASARSASGDVLVMAHAGVNRIILCHVLGLEPARLMRLGQDYGALNLIGLDSGSFRLLGLNLRPGSWP